eukprot:3870418-Pyramimonas_sp.AAC.1
MRGSWGPQGSIRNHFGSNQARTSPSSLNGIVQMPWAHLGKLLSDQCSDEEAGTGDGEPPVVEPSAGLQAAIASECLDEEAGAGDVEPPVVGHWAGLEAAIASECLDDVEADAGDEGRAGVDVPPRHLTPKAFLRL